MTGWEYVAASLGAGFVFSTAFLIIALGSLDDLRDQLLRERAIRAVQDRVLTAEQRTCVDIALNTGADPTDVAGHLLRALRRPVKGPLQ